VQDTVHYIFRHSKLSPRDAMFVPWFPVKNVNDHHSPWPVHRYQSFRIDNRIGQPDATI
jgi:hypothetical protein